MATPSGPADLAVKAVVVDKEGCPEFQSTDAWEEALSWEEKAGPVLQEESHGEGCNKVRSRFCWPAERKIGSGMEESRIDEAQVQEDEEGWQGLHVRLKAAHLRHTVRYRDDYESYHEVLSEYKTR